ncbi:MAG: SDR family NAD(P)-dependent oxidoreductase [Terriglobia bacterium]
MQYSLVTGASSGIGECFARALGARKQNLVLVARSENKLKVLAEELSGTYGIHTEPIALDLSAPRAAATLFQAIQERKIEVNLLVNNAGFGAQGPFWEIPLDQQSQIIHLNVQALIELTYFFLPAMIQKRSGGVINVSSTASFQPLPYTTVYAASKAFVTSFSTGLAEEVRPHGVNVVTLCPGTTRTNFFKAGGFKSMNLRFAFQAPEEVAEAGLRKLDRGGGLVLSRKMDSILLLGERVLPRSWVARMTAGLFKVK